MPAPPVKKLKFGSSDADRFTDHMSVVSGDLRLVPFGSTGFEVAAHLFRPPRCAIFTLDWKGAEGLIQDEARLLGLPSLTGVNS